MELFTVTFCSPRTRANPPGKEFFKTSFSARAYVDLNYEKTNRTFA